jgi:hypothetical protein
MFYGVQYDLSGVRYQPFVACHCIALPICKLFVVYVNFGIVSLVFS